MAVELSGLEAVLQQFLLPDNNARKQAENTLKTVLKSSTCVTALLQSMQHSQAPEIRQLTAILLRKKISSHWPKLSSDSKEKLKAVLLEMIVTEASHTVRRAVADLVSSVAGLTMPAGEWAALLQCLLQCSQSAKEDHREVALLLFSSLTETIGDVLRPHFPSLHSVIMAGLRDSHSNRVRVAALRAVGSLVDFVESEQEMSMFRELIPPILDVARFCATNGDELSVVKTCEILDEMVESPSMVLGPVVPSLVQFSLELVSNKTLEISTRRQAIQLLSWLSEWKPKLLIKHKLVIPILAVLCPLLAPETLALGDRMRDEGNGEEDEDMALFVAQAIDAMAVGLPSKQLLPPITAFVRASSASVDGRQREAAQMAIAAIAEGCSELLRKSLQDVLSLVLPATHDPIQSVRAASCFAIGQLAEHVQPEMSEAHQQVLPAIFNALNDASPAVQERAYYAMSVSCENLGSDILSYLDPLMRTLSLALQSSKRDLQEMCIAAIGSAAAAAESDFLPYADGVLSSMTVLVELQQVEDVGVRSKAIELVGIVGVACGRKTVEPYLPRFMEAAFQAFDSDNSELREYSHGFFGQLAQILEEDFAQFLSRVVPLALASCQLDDGEVVASDGLDEEPGSLAGAFSDDDDDDVSDDEESGKLRSVNVRTGVLDEKSAATQALGLFALHTNKHFALYFDPVLNVLRKHSCYFHEDVRLQALLALQHLFTASLAAFPNIPSSTAGAPASLAPQALHIYNSAVDVYLRAAMEDDDKECVAQACGALNVVIKEGTVEALLNYAEKICTVVLRIMRGEAVCQRKGGSEGEEEAELEDESEHDEILMDAATEVLPAMAEVLGAAFGPAFAAFFPEIMKFTDVKKSDGDRSMAVACIAEVAKFMGAPIAPYIEALLPVLFQELQSPEPSNRRNSAFCLGILCLHGGPLIVPHYPRLLAALHPLFVAPRGSRGGGGVRDNACGAVARMISANTSAVPLGQVLPVLLDALPLEEDLEEAEVVYGCLSSLLLQGHAEALPFASQVVNVFSRASSTTDISEEAKSSIRHTVAQLCAVYPEQMRSLLELSKGDEASALATIMP